MPTREISGQRLQPLLVGWIVDVQAPAPEHGDLQRDGLAPLMAPGYLNVCSGSRCTSMLFEKPQEDAVRFFSGLAHTQFFQRSG